MTYKSKSKILDILDVQLVIFDFDGVFTDNKVMLSENNVEFVNCWRSDGLGLSRLKSLRIPMKIVSSEKNPVVSKRALKLGIHCIQGVDNKAKELKNICEEFNISLKNTMFVGNDINDIPALKLVGFPIAVADAYPEILPYIIFRTKKNGGEGAVREICDLIYYAHKKQ